MLNRHPFSNQQVARTHCGICRIVAKPFIPCRFIAAFACDPVLGGRGSAPLLKTSCYAVGAQRVEDASVRKRRARR